MAEEGKKSTQTTPTASVYLKLIHSVEKDFKTRQCRFLGLTTKNKKIQNFDCA